MKTQKLFSMRVEGEEGEEFLSALDELRQAERPQVDRTAMIKKLVFQAHARSFVAKERGKR